jgi:hypothetical protein
VAAEQVLFKERSAATGWIVTSGSALRRASLSSESTVPHGP